MTSEAQQRVHELFNSKVSDLNLVYEFNLSDKSVVQKRYSTEYYLNELKSLKIKDYELQPSPSTTQSTNNPITTQPPLLDINGYCLDLNRILDGFFMNSMSVLDTLAHQLSTLYYFQRIPNKIYISTMKDDLIKYHPSSRIGTLLDERLKQTWFTDFEPFRHCTTHESLIPYDINPGYDFINQRWLPPEIKLPENPQIRPPQQTRNREPISFCQTIFDNIESLLNEVYEAILLDIQNNNNILPIGRP